MGISAIELFSSWAEMGKDKGMEKGHNPSVEFMISKVIPKLNSDFTAIDIGCGNGWTVRKLNSVDGCTLCFGVDGSESMISKAKEIDPTGTYLCEKLPDWKPENTSDLVISMEFIYYLKAPLNFLSELNQNWLNNDGILAIGIDHYVENKSSLSWPDSLGVHMTTLSIQEWIEGFKSAGFRDVEFYQCGAKEDWAGTLVILGRK
tara:strand:+ start:412 stop:1023 length:612 start_codon:yes stop_codon:yes gene_type:complete